MLLKLPWFQTGPHTYSAMTLAGMVMIRGNAMAPFQLNVSIHVRGYSVYLGTKRVSWTQDWNTALIMASDSVKTKMSQRSRTNVLPD